MTDLHLAETVELGQDAQRGNLLGVQPYLTSDDYASPETLRARLGGYMRAAGEKGWLSARTVVVFPEYIGTWLVSAAEGLALARAPTIAVAMRRLALRHAPAFALALLTAQEKDKVSASLFRMKAGRLAADYQAVFGGLAREFGVTVVAGSILLPAPEVRDRHITAGHGPLYNTSAVFRPDGSPYASLVRKIYPTSAEQPFVTAASVADLPVFETPAGRLGVLVCADSWYPAPYSRLKDLGAEAVVVPSYISVNGLWDKPWGGYDGAPAPADVDPGDVGRLTEGQAWRKYALAGRLQQAGAAAGLNVFLRGALWDAGADSGNALAIRGDQVTEAASKGAALLNLWL